MPVQCTETPGPSSGSAEEDRTLDPVEEALRWELLDELLHSAGRAWPVVRDTQGEYWMTDSSLLLLAEDMFPSS